MIWLDSSGLTLQILLYGRYIYVLLTAILFFIKRCLLRSNTHVTLSFMPQGLQLLWVPIYFPVHQSSSKKGSTLKADFDLGSTEKKTQPQWPFLFRQWSPNLEDRQSTSTKTTTVYFKSLAQSHGCLYPLAQHRVVKTKILCEDPFVSSESSNKTFNEAHISDDHTFILSRHYLLAGYLRITVLFTFNYYLTAWWVTLIFNIYVSGKIKNIFKNILFSVVVQALIRAPVRWNFHVSVLSYRVWYGVAYCG